MFSLIGALRDELRLLASRFGASLDNLTCVQLNANLNQTSRGASVQLVNTPLKDKLLLNAFRVVLTA